VNYAPLRGRWVLLDLSGLSAVNRLAVDPLRVVEVVQCAEADVQGRNLILARYLLPAVLNVGVKRLCRDHSSLFTSRVLNGANLIRAGLDPSGHHE